MQHLFVADTKRKQEALKASLFNSASKYVKRHAVSAA